MCKTDDVPPDQATDSMRNGWTWPFTVTVMSSLADKGPSPAVNRRTYAPLVEKLAVVLNALAFANVTVPEPLNLLHPNKSSPGGIGRPSSLTVPFSVALAGSVMVWSEPAFADGPWFGGKAEPDNSRSNMMSLLVVLAW